MTATAPEGENGDREGESIKIGSELQTSLSILTLIETKKAVCECTDTVIKDKYGCKIFAVLISLYVNS